MTEDRILDSVGVSFIIETLILSEKMRDKRLTDLDQDKVESLATELYHYVEIMRSDGEGYLEICNSANNIIENILS